ncbi:GNAT family N-acetyltransferase [Sphingobacterium griseoflavum]|nr:GNAT family protein [Sphingobacterium griseoflavum]
MGEHSIVFEEFKEADFPRLISWITTEEQLVQFAGTAFHFPLTKEQLIDHLKEPDRHIFKVIHQDTNAVIGHCEVYEEDLQTRRLCRILIGDKRFLGKGYGAALVAKLTKWCFSKPAIEVVALNVYDFNTAAINCYIKNGFIKVGLHKSATQVGHERWYSFRMTVNRSSFAAMINP